MPAERVSMRKIRDVLRLTHAMGMSRRVVGEVTGIGKTAVGDYVRRASTVGLNWPIPEEIDDAELERRLFAPMDAAVSDAARSEPDWPHIQAELKRRGVTLTLLWQEYRTEHPQGCAYSWFCEQYGAWRKSLAPTMRQTHLAGEKLFVDWAGDTVALFDAATGEKRHAHIFVAALGASNYTYAEARWSEKLPDWIGAHVNLLAAIGGVPSALVPDNLKAGITKPSRYEPGINRTYQDLADHYGCVVLPTRIRHPRDKAKVEVAVQIVERFVVAKLRNRTFFSLAELNAAISDCVAAINNKIMRHVGKSRAELLETLDRPALKPLPATPYSYAEWKRARVAPDYHIEIAGHYYSVPSKLIREIVEARTTSATVEIFHKGRRIASHAFSAVRNRHTTIVEHMPSAHRRYAEWTPAKMMDEAAKVGTATVALFEAIMKVKPHPEQGFRSCLGILSLVKSYGPARVEAACRRGNDIGATTYGSIASILKNGLDKAYAGTQPNAFAADTADDAPIHHDNIRGRDYYH
jgi:transposase